LKTLKITGEKFLFGLLIAMTKGECMKYLAILMIVFIAGCASSYQPNGISGGYSEIRLADDTYKVSFRGNGYTSAEKATDLAMLRAADLTLMNGYRYFVVVDSSDSLNTTYNPGSQRYETQIIGYDTGNYIYGEARTTQTGVQAYTTSKPRSTNTIVMLNEKPSSFSYDASYIYSSLKAAYGVK
jgi:hypothetical protein